jgi:hypothetical protein
MMEVIFATPAGLRNEINFRIDPGARRADSRSPFVVRRVRRPVAVDRRNSGVVLSKKPYGDRAELDTGYASDATVQPA